MLKQSFTYGRYSWRVRAFDRPPEEEGEDVEVRVLLDKVRAGEILTVGGEMPSKEIPWPSHIGE